MTSPCSGPMTYERLRGVTSVATLIFLGWIVTLVLASEHGGPYALLKDLTPAVIAVPAAWLAFSFNQRLAHQREHAEWRAGLLRLPAEVSALFDTGSEPEITKVITLAGNCRVLAAQTDALLGIGTALAGDVRGFGTVLGLYTNARRKISPFFPQGSPLSAEQKQQLWERMHRVSVHRQHRQGLV